MIAKETFILVAHFRKAAPVVRHGAAFCAKANYRQAKGFRVFKCAACKCFQPIWLKRAESPQGNQLYGEAVQGKCFSEKEKSAPDGLW